MRLATLAALAGIIGLAHPALALDKVRFGTNWLADPEAGGFFQAAADGTYAKYGLDVTIMPGGPQSNGGLMLLFGKLEFFMGGDMIGNYLVGRGKAAAHRRRRRLSEVRRKSSCRTPASGSTNGRTCPRPGPSMSARARSTPSTPGCGIAYGFKDENIRPYNFNSAPFMKNKIRSSRAM